MTSFSEIWSRIRLETDLEKISELAILIETTPQYVSRKKKNNDFSVEWAFKIALKYNLSTDWIMTGKGPKRREEPDPSYKNSILHDIDRWLSEQIKKEPFRKDWFMGAFLDAFPKFDQWKKNQENTKNEYNTPGNSKAA